MGRGTGGENDERDTYFLKRYREWGRGLDLFFEYTPHKPGAGPVCQFFFFLM